MTGLVVVTVVVATVAAFLLGRLNPSKARFVPAQRLAALDERLAAVERSATTPPDQLEKLLAVFHYEALASELDYERQLAELDGRLAEVERGAVVPHIIWTASRNGSATGGRRDA